ncbi:MAG: glycine--tRNA ligase [Planctomycetota bacterium]|jgi:glycyl-tRNA synthetase|nr:glycine--tRNA ligase [Planctomycetota bacterium]
MSQEVSVDDRMNKLVSLCKRRGFVFQSSEIYGGLKSCYDYGPLGVELKRNVTDNWWRSMVHEREDVVGLDASIIMHPDVWKASGHLDGFSDPLVECMDCHVRFRADKAPRMEPGTEVTFRDAKKKKVTAPVLDRGYVCSDCGSPRLSEERAFNLMFSTHLGPVASEENTVYLRPETAQAMFVNFLNVQQSYRLKIPFGIAQVGKSFRNEITVRHFIFRSCEFEQMEMEFFVEPGSDDEWFEYWKKARLQWYVDLGIDPSNLRLRPHEKDELAHYAKGCSDVEYRFPWGWDELEGIANRTDYDLRKHQEASGKKLEIIDPNREDPNTGKRPFRYLPYVIEPAAGATRAVLAFLLDAYDEEPPSETRKDGRVVLRLHPRVAPIKAAVLPLIKKDENLTARARAIVKEFWGHGINSFYDEKDSIGRRYARQDEAGTPFCLTVDGQTLEEETVTIRYRDDMRQERIEVSQAVDIVRKKVMES